MTTTELITALRDLAYECEDPPRTKLIKEAADRLEAPGNAEWNVFETITSAYGGKQIFFKQNNGIIYDRYKGEYITFEEAIIRFCKLIGDDGIDY